MTDREGPHREPESAWYAAGQHAGYGLTWALSTLFFLWIGWVVDGRLGTVPLFTIVGAFVGAAAGFYSFYRHVMARRSDGHGPEGRNG